MRDNEILISVVITAYNRREYLINALNSVLSQTLHKEKYEIIVIKNFYDSNIDEVLKRNCVLNIYESDPNFIKIIKKAIDYSNSDIISFLDDDDEFCENKLERISAIFNKDASIIYIHNDHVAIDSEDKNLNFSITPSSNGGITLESKSGFAELAKFQKIGGFFNSSSIAIRKKYISDALDNYPDLELFAGPDAFLFIAALNAELKLMHIDEKLTKYRVHYKNMSGEFKENRKYSLIKYQENSYRAYSDLSKISKFRREANLMLMLSFESFLRLELTDHLISRKKTLKSSIKLLGFSLLFKSIYRMVLAFIGLVLTIAPSSSRLIYKKYLEITSLRY